MSKFTLTLIVILAFLTQAQAQVPFQILGQFTNNTGQQFVWILSNGPSPQKIWVCDTKWGEPSPPIPVPQCGKPSVLPQADPQESYILASPVSQGIFVSAFVVSNRNRVIQCVRASFNGFVYCSNAATLQMN